VSLDLIREGKTKTVKLPVGTMPEEVGKVAASKKESDWGISVQNLTAELAKRYGLDAGERGVVVVGVEQGSPAAEVRLRPGDLIREINRQKIQNLRDYNQALEAAAKDESLLLLIKRGEGSFYIALTPQKKEK
jgi:serine protease Do